MFTWRDIKTVLQLVFIIPHMMYVLVLIFWYLMRQ